jgi:hypothetical protein
MWLRLIQVSLLLIGGLLITRISPKSVEPPLANLGSDEVSII